MWGRKSQAAQQAGLDAIGVAHEIAPRLGPSLDEELAANLFLEDERLHIGRNAVVIHEAFVEARALAVGENAGDEAEVIRQDLLHVPGVKKINILGERPEQIFVEFSYARLATLGVSAQDIVAAVQRQNTVTPAGSIDTKGPQVFIRVDGAYDSVQAIADTPIRNQPVVAR